jgi:hypothetical protein
VSHLRPHSFKLRPTPPCASTRARVPPAAQALLPYLNQLLSNDEFMALPFDFTPRHATEFDAEKMRALLSIRLVQRDIARFVTDVMIASPLVFLLGREAKMEVMAALGRQGANMAADAFVEAFEGQDNGSFLQAAFDAAADGRQVPTYVELLEQSKRPAGPTRKPCWISRAQTCEESCS